MSSFINGLSSNVQSILASSLQNVGLSTNSANTNSLNAVSGQQPDSSGLSPLGQILSTLQQLQQTDPAKYQQVTQQIAANLQTAAQTAQSNGNTTEANQLTQLSTDFTTASQSGQLPNIKDLAQALGAGGHHHHHAQAAGTDSDGDNDGSSSSSTSSNPASSSSSSISQLLASLQSSTTSQADPLNPFNIIQSTLTSAGITINS